jgi:hypothetical protein
MRRSALVCILLVLACTSCVAFNKRRVMVGRSTSLGAELRDLKRALDAGALTEAEYRAVKAALEREEARVLYPVGDEVR